MREGSKFCESCGYALEATAPSSEPTPIPQAQAPSEPTPAPQVAPLTQQDPTVNCQQSTVNYQPSPLSSLNSQLPPPPGKGKPKLCIPIAAVVVVLVVAVGALWQFSDTLTWTNKSGELPAITIQPPGIRQDSDETDNNAAGTEVDTEPVDEEDETQTPSFSLPLPDNLPIPPAPPEIDEKNIITPLEARAILQTWLEHHPFQFGAMLEPEEYMLSGETQGEPYSEGGDDYYRFYVGIVMAGVARILVHQETGELFHSESRSSSTWFAPIDVWYDSDHAAGAAPISAYDAWVIYDVWLDRNWELNDYTIDLHSYEIYELDGEYYYWFRANNPEWYWYNILVNMYPGEILFMMISDGEYPVVEIEPLDDFYNRHFGLFGRL